MMAGMFAGQHVAFMMMCATVRYPIIYTVVKRLNASGRYNFLFLVCISSKVGYNLYIRNNIIFGRN